MCGIKCQTKACKGVKLDQLGRYQSGQLEQTVNLSSYDFEGSNPSLPTHLNGCHLPFFEDDNFI